jgi:IS4 transposase
MSSKVLAKVFQFSVHGDTGAAKLYFNVITNQFNWSPSTIGELYKSRWQVEILFRCIKQLLHIKSFIGTSENAVVIEIWTDLITILISKKRKPSATHLVFFLPNTVNVKCSKIFSNAPR